MVRMGHVWYRSQGVKDQVKVGSAPLPEGRGRPVLLLGHVPDEVGRSLERWGLASRTADLAGLSAALGESPKAAVVDGLWDGAASALDRLRGADVPIVLFRSPDHLTGQASAGALYPRYPGAEELRRAVLRLIACPAPPADLAIPVDPFLDFLRDRFGLVFPPRRTGDIRNAIRERMQVLRLPDASHYLERLERVGPEDPEPDHLVGTLTVGETFLYRTPAHFEELRQRRIGDLMYLHPREPLRVLSAGCSTGEEAYCLAALLLEAVPASRVSVLGADVNRQSLEIAKAGHYRRPSIRNDLPGWIQSQLVRDGDGLAASPTLRKVTSFAYLNLAAWSNGGPGPPGPFDVIFCRNVLLYFEPGTASRILSRLAVSLAPGGLLFLGPSETVLGRETGLEVRAGRDCFYLEKPHPARRNLPPPPLSAPHPLPEVPDPTPPTMPPPGFLPRPGEELRRRIDEMVQKGFRRLDEEDFAGARTLFERAARYDPAASGPRVGLLFLASNQGDSRTVAAEGKSLVDEGVVSADLHYLLGLMADLEGAPDRARREFERSLYLDPECFMARFRIAEIAARTGNRSQAGREARNLLEQVRTLPPGSMVRLSGGLSREGLEALCLGILRSGDEARA